MHIRNTHVPNIPTYIYTYIYIDNFPFSPQVWGSLRSPQLLRAGLLCYILVPRPHPLADFLGGAAGAALGPGYEAIV